MLGDMTEHRLHDMVDLSVALGEHGKEVGAAGLSRRVAHGVIDSAAQPFADAVGEGGQESLPE